jgi:hypothetical protein
MLESLHYDRIVFTHTPLSTSRRVATGLLVGLAALLPTVAPAGRPAPGERVLFIGNSLTAANDLPGLVEALSRVTSGPALACRAVVFADHSLEDHWARGDAARAIADGGWSVVVLQQGPSALPESQVLLREYTKRFDAAIRKTGARTALYMVWPSQARMQDFDGVSASYTAAAKDVDGLLLPVGDAWRAAWKRDATLSLYGADGFNPSPLGSYLAALVVYQGLTGRSPIGLPATLHPPAGGAALVVPPPQARVLQDVAAAIARRTSPGTAAAGASPSARR